MSSTISVAEIKELMKYATEEERAVLQEHIDSFIKNEAPVFVPQPGPQTSAYLSPADIVGFGGSAGGGKGLALNTAIPTPSGWTTMGDLKVGDEIFDRNGYVCVVTAVSEINNRRCFKLVFDDGIEIVADDVHRWVTFDEKELAGLTRRDPEWKEKRRKNRPSRAKGNKSEKFKDAIAARNAQAAKEKRADNLPAPEGSMRDTLEIFKTVLVVKADGKPRTNHAIKTAAPLQTGRAKLFVPPYTLGAWLGDGTSASGGFTGIDPEIWERIEKDGFTVSHSRSCDANHYIQDLKIRLREIGVLDNKHIPIKYLRASAEQRLDLLRGLMDTDGHIAPDGGCEYVSTNERLADGVLELARSLGIKATKNSGVAKLNGVAISQKWRVLFTTGLCVFNLPRKAARVPAKTRRTTKFRYIVRCEEIESVPTRCISVSSLTKQFLVSEAMIPTHNSSLICGLALTQHTKSLILRQDSVQLQGIKDDLVRMVGHRNGFNEQKNLWREPLPGKQIEMGGLLNEGDEEKYRGRDHDFLAFDELTEFREYQFRFVQAWVRTTVPGLHCRILATFNPPRRRESMWVIKYFGPWLDPNHPNRAMPGELRYFATVSGEDIEVSDGRPFILKSENELIYDFDPKEHDPINIIKPESRTFIPSRLVDNVFLDDNYLRKLQALPEPLRSQMLLGDFSWELECDPMQVIPDAWVDAAQARWEPVNGEMPPMDSMGVDIARGGKDFTEIARRHGSWFDRPISHPGSDTPDGVTAATFVMHARRDDCPVHIDAIGVGTSPTDTLTGWGVYVIPVIANKSSPGTDRSGLLTFTNIRSWMWWKMREALDPANGKNLALPPDKDLKEDLCSPRYYQRGSKIYVQSRDEIIKTLKRSPDRGTAYVQALIDTPRRRQKKKAIVETETYWELA